LPYWLDILLFEQKRYLGFFKDVISDRDSGTGSVKRCSTWFKAVCEVKWENVVMACGEEL
jgi:hypothetical protein